MPLRKEEEGAPSLATLSLPPDSFCLSLAPFCCLSLLLFTAILFSFLLLNFSCLFLLNFPLLFITDFTNFSSCPCEARVEKRVRVKVKRALVRMTSEGRSGEE